MTSDFDAVAKELHAYFPAAGVTVEYPGFISVVFQEDGRSYAAGNSNQTWTVDYYASLASAENGTPDSGADTHLPSHHGDPWLVALNIAAAISRMEVE